MKLNTKYILAGMCICLCASCEDNLLEEEQYQKIIYLQSGDDNIFEYSHAVNDSITRGYLTVGSGGTMPLEHNVTVTLELDSAGLNVYNQRRFDIEYDKYAKFLDASRFVLPSYEIVLRANDANATTFFPIEVDANGLSPDTVYIVPLKIKSVSDYEVNLEKASVLYKIALKNKYSEPGKTSYAMKGTKQIAGGTLSAITNTKDVIPLSKNRVRIFPENLQVSSNLEDIENKTITITVNEDNSIRVRPYKNVQAENVGRNWYDDKDEVFNLSYRYRLPGEDKWNYIEETLTRVQ